MSNTTFSDHVKAGILGIDHVGINVPDMKQALEFFSEVLGFSSVTTLGPIPLDAAWKEGNNMHNDTGPLTIKMVHAGTGASIEVFAYENNHGSKQHPGGDDIGASHIGFYTADIHSAVSYLKSKGIKILGDPFLMPSGDTEGETWVYFLSPWGSKMELVSYPNGKGYETTKPEKLLWSPKNAGQSANDNADLTEEEVKLITDKHLDLWNELDQSKHLQMMDTIYSTDIEMVDRHFIAVGHAEVKDFVTDLHAKHPDSRFSHAKPVEFHHHIIRMYWQSGPPAKPDAATGMDMFVIKNNKVQKLYVFVDEAKS